VKSSRNIDELEQIAMRIRRAAGLEAVGTFDVVDVTENQLPVTFPGLKLIRVHDEQLPYAEAEANASTNTILVRESIYQKATEWNPRARMIIMEEVCHIALGHHGPRFRRHGTLGKVAYSQAEKRDEHEARQLAALLLAPTFYAKQCSSPEEIVERFFISAEAAEYRWEEVQRAKRRETGTPRALPPVVIDFLREQKRRGHRVTSLDDDEDRH
jgi:Zn-dependent peptidase ImmA (M78 family)